MTLNQEEEEEAATRNYNLGISRGLDQASKTLMNAAVGFFERGKDDIANILREQAKRFELDSAKIHPGIPN